MIRLLLLGMLAAFPVRAEMYETSAGPVNITPIVTGLDEPWAVAFPPGGVLITLREGRLLYGAGGELQSVSGVPRVFARGQGGLLDVAVARDFARSNEVFLTYSELRGRKSGTALAVAKFDPDGPSLSDVRVIFRQQYSSNKGQHFGSRVVEADDGTLFVTVGDRGAREQAQDTRRHNGKVIRVNRDGSIPADNPFAGGGGQPEIWSFGHRNPQGAALDLQGRIWTVEHGARGGDEINRPEAGRNYGWPVISYGVHYSGGKIGEGTEKAGMEQPEFYWDPSIAPSGMMIYSGKLWPQWKGDTFVGSLKFSMISRLEGGTLREAERLFQDEFSRIRDIREAPDGSIWFLSVGEETLYRMTP